MKKKIYIQLLNEGSVAYRPVSAYEIEDDLYKIDGSEVYDSDDEKWEFNPGSYVVVEQRKLGEEFVLVAVKEENR